MDSERRLRRVENELPVMVEKTEMLTNNISLAGMQITMPSIPSGEMSLVDDKLPATVTLPDNTQVRTQCRMVYLADDGEQALAGLEITSFEEEDFVVWAQYVKALYN